MSPGKVAIAGKLLRWRIGIGNDALYRRTNLACQTFRHAVPGFAESHGQHTRIGAQLVEIIAHAQHAAFVLDMAAEGLFNARLGQSAREDLASHGTHLCAVRHQLASTCSCARKNLAVQLRMAVCISARWPSKKWSPPSTITNSFGAGAISTNFSRLGRGLYWSRDPLTNSLGIGHPRRKS